MSVLVNDFLAEIEKIASNPDLTYRIGGIGEDGTCDCIGLIMGAMYALGHPEYDLHSTNYFARWQMQTLAPVSEVTLTPGMLLYKARADAGDLHARYRDPGERYYNGDLRDWYHVGVVTSIRPFLEITHCTSGNGVDGIQIDTSTKGWTHAGMLKGVDYSGGAPESEEEPEVMTYQAIVTTPDGMPLKMRAKPNANEKLYWKIPNGTILTVTESAQGWATVEWEGRRGYCMSQYLIPAGVQAENGLSELDFGVSFGGDATSILMAMNDKLDVILAKLEGGGAVG